MKIRFAILSLALILAGFQPVFSEVKLPKIFSDNMVLQRDLPIPVWGWANKNEKITIQINGQSRTVKAGKNGEWKTTFDPMKAGGPYRITVEGKNTIVFENILVGDVWICSGQSNMEWPVASSNNPQQEIANADYPQIRLFTAPKSTAKDPLDDVEEGSWQAVSPETIAGFSAVGYFFGRELHQNLDIPIGLINTSWGGTVVETWTSREAISSIDDFKKELSELSELDFEKKRQEILDQMEAYKPAADENPQSLGEEKALWADPSYNDQQWHEMKVPGFWEASRLPSLDGVVWFRKTFNLEKIPEKAVLSLGPIDDNDITWVNGVKVGETNKYDEDRMYTVDPSILKVGKNVLAIRVEDTGGGGGIWGDEVFLETAENKINLSGDWKFLATRAEVFTTVNPNDYPTLLFNAMINPLVPYGIKGAIWYQGESNAGRPYQYRKLFSLLINDWRNHWEQGEFPFLFVQLANFETSEGSDWPALREAQTMTLSLPNTGMAVTIDIGNPRDIHPRNKQDVGKRLALAARKVAYGEDLVYSGPLFRSMKIENGKAILTFDHTGAGLTATDKYGHLRGFQIAGKDRKFLFARAEIVDDQTVVVYHKNIKEPVAVRYAWSDNPEDANLYNQEMLPASPFRTDDWR